MARGQVRAQERADQSSTDHQRHQTLNREVGPRTLADHSSVAQHDDVVAKTQDIAEDVADVDNRDALRAQPTDNLEQALRLARRQRRRRFVKDYKAGLSSQRFNDLDELTFALRKPHDRRRRRNLQINEIERLLRLFSEGASVNEWEAAHSSWEMIEEDVLLDAEIWKETQLLVNEGDPKGERIARIRRRDVYPASSTRPLSRVKTPPRMFIVVDLPEPFSPTRPRTAPDVSSIPTSRSTWTPKEAFVETADLEKPLGHR